MQNQLMVVSMKERPLITVKNHYPFLQLHADAVTDVVGEKREETSIDADAAYGLYED